MMMMMVWDFKFCFQIVSCVWYCVAAKFAIFHKFCKYCSDYFFIFKLLFLLLGRLLNQLESRFTTDGYKQETFVIKRQPSAIRRSIQRPKSLSSKSSEPTHFHWNRRLENNVNQAAKVAPPGHKVRVNGMHISSHSILHPPQSFYVQYNSLISAFMICFALSFILSLMHP